MEGTDNEYTKDLESTSKVIEVLVGITAWIPNKLWLLIRLFQVLWTVLVILTAKSIYTLWWAKQLMPLVKEVFIETWRSEPKFKTISFIFLNVCSLLLVLPSIITECLFRRMEKVLPKTKVGISLLRDLLGDKSPSITITLFFLVKLTLTLFKVGFSSFWLALAASFIATSIVVLQLIVLSWALSKSVSIISTLLSPDEQEEWLGDLKEIQYQMIHEENRPKWYVHIATLKMCFERGFSKVQILLSDAWNWIISS
ncbi:MAG: hypothetical protein AAGF93_20440 [Cyanobacteria bacterium P01_H01_bin.105]